MGNDMVKLRKQLTYEEKNKICNKYSAGVKKCHSKDNKLCPLCVGIYGVGYVCYKNKISSLEAEINRIHNEGIEV